MASYPQSLARLTAPQMSNSKKQPGSFGAKGMKNAAARRLQKTRKVGKLPMNNGSY